MDDSQTAINRERPRRPWRFRLRTLIAAMTLVCVIVALQSNSANRQQRAVEHFLGVGARVSYDYQRQTSPPNRPGRGKSPFGVSYSARAKPPGPAWLRGLLGDHYFVTAVSLVISDPRTAENDGLAYLKTCHGSRNFTFMMFR